ncbi:hypothetical protein [Mariniflexile sp. AS56]|uniref:hypothetical protein n=1 Tax=Mariniflexile sp. AS56 TaxID=3063957 RepID=UPI0026EA1A51|nr:hypothetical protein [Mariniflexile sp. AS56]MDO7173234.1 hypothetical protein [Mariniflexile sp. AS56]
MNFHNKYFINFKADYMLYVPLTIILQSCIGSVAAMYILMNSKSPTFLLELSLCVIVSMAYNASIMAQLTYKWVFNLLILSLVTNVALIVLNLMRLQ